MKEQLHQLSKRIESNKGYVKNEEATKHAFILPFLQILGFDPLNPKEVVPEYACGFTSKTDNVDYAIIIDGKPQIIIECKHHSENISNHLNQLHKYFVSSDAKIGIITNGIEYWFFTDSVETNKMDESPFLKLDITDVSDKEMEWLSLISKENFSLESIKSKLSDSNDEVAIKNAIKDELSNPSRDFVNLIAKRCGFSNVRSGDIKKLFPIIKEYLKEIVPIYRDNQINENLVLPETEQKIIDTLNDILSRCPEYDNMKIYHHKGFTSFCYYSEWWPAIKLFFLKTKTRVDMRSSLSSQFVKISYSINSSEELSDFLDEIFKAVQYTIELKNEWYAKHNK